MNTKHTPGPWAISRDAVPAGWVQNTICAEGSGERVATAFLAEENAHLIAAAPDLLAALENLTATTRTFCNVPKDDQERTPLDDQTIEAAFTAIARAKGG